MISVNGFRFYVSFVDDFTKYTWLFPIANKSDVLMFKPLVENLFSNRIKILRTDGEGEFVNNTLRSYLSSHGILHQISCPYTLEQNGVAEPKHRHIVETVVTFMSWSSLPLNFWSYAFTAAVFPINRLPSSSFGQKSPFECLYHCLPEYTFLKVFGCACYPLLKPCSSHKLQPKFSQCVFLGYSMESKGYLCYNMSNAKIYTSRHVIFDENIFPLPLPSSSSVPSPSPSYNATLPLFLTTLYKSSTIPSQPSLALII